MPLAREDLPSLPALLRAELGAGILGLRLFVASVALAAALLGIVWMLGNGLGSALTDNARRILGGDVAVTVVNTPLSEDLVARLAEQGAVSRVAELRSTSATDAGRVPIELKAVDDAYPLYGRVATAGPTALQPLLARQDGRFGAVVEPALMTRLGLELGGSLRIGQRSFAVRGVLRGEPDRLSAGGFLIGPRVLIGYAAFEGTGLTGRGSLTQHRYRLRAPEGTTPEALRAAVQALEPERGWDLESPHDAGDRVRRTAERTTTFLGIAGLAAFAIGLSGAWAAARVWIGRRTRTIALYRLSGATAPLVVALHAVIVAVAGLLGLALGLAVAVAASFVLMDMLAARLHLSWTVATSLTPAWQIALTLLVGLAGAATPALAAAARTPPAQAMRGGATGHGAAPLHAAVGVLVLAFALVLAVLGLPDPLLAAVAATGLAVAAGLLGLAGWALAGLAARRQPDGFVALVVRQGLAAPGAAATKALALGIGIAGIVAVVGAQNSLQSALESELPQRAPDLMLLDVQPDQVEPIRARVAEDPALGALQATPFMRMRLLEVNGTPVQQALVREDKRWVIEGDRSFSWTAEPTGAELLAGEWWPTDYTGPPLVSPEEDVAEAFALQPGDALTYSVLGRVFTSEVAGIRKEYHRTLRPEFLMVASPQPFRDAPHTWIVTLQGETETAVDTVIADLAETAPNVTSIDASRLVAQVRSVVDGAVLGTLAIAATLLLAGALSLAAVVAADVEARRREALAFAPVGASRREIAVARLVEAAAVGALAALLGGAAGLLGSWWLAAHALRLDWAPGTLAFVLPLGLGLLAALAAGAAGGMAAVPRGRGQLARQLAG